MCLYWIYIYYIRLKIIAKPIREYYLNFYMVDNKDWDK